MKKFMAVFWEEKVVRKYFTVQAENEAEAREKFEAEEGMTLDHEEFVERTDGGNCLDEYGIQELSEDKAEPKPSAKNTMAKPRLTLAQFKATANVKMTMPDGTKIYKFYNSKVNFCYQDDDGKREFYINGNSFDKSSFLELYSNVRENGGGIIERRKEDEHKATK